MITQTLKRSLCIFTAILFVFALYGCENRGAELVSTKLQISQKSFYPDKEELYYSLLRLRDALMSDNPDPDGVLEIGEKVLRDMDGLGELYRYEGNLGYYKDGEYYGADTTSPIGGGEGYTDIITTGDYIVHDDDEFAEALRTARSGEVIFIDSGSAINLSDMRVAEGLYALLNKGVTIASDRGYNGSKGGTLYFSLPEHTALLRCGGNNRITGLTLEGGAGNTAHGYTGEKTSVGIIALAKNVEIDNCEISGFFTGGIRIRGEGSVHHCYLHNIFGEGSSAIDITGGNITVSNNLFSNNEVNISCDRFENITIENNIDAGNVKQASIVLGSKRAVTDTTQTSVTIKNNSFLGSAPGFITKDEEPGDIVAVNNIFDFQKDSVLSSYGSSGEKITQDLPNIVLPDIVTGVFAGDTNQVYESVKLMLENLNDKEKARRYATDAVSELCMFSRYYEYEDSLYIIKDEVLYGAYSPPGEPPIGGGVGDYEKITSGDYIVTDAESLAAALDSAKPGEVVFVKGSIEIEKSVAPLALKPGVTLAGDRGTIGESGKASAGGVLYTVELIDTLIVAGDDSKISGLIIAGPDTEKHMTHHKRGTGAGGYTNYYYALPLTVGVKVVGDRFEMTNCEVSGFSNSGVLIEKGYDAYIHNSYFHHNQRNGFGYGVCLGKSATAVIEYNLFNFDRHSVAANGSPGSGYTASNNIQMGDAIYHVFDAHGGFDRGDNTNIACDYVEMYNNTILCDALPYKRRGKPVLYSKFYNNIVVNPEEYYNTRLLDGPNMTYYDNIFGLYEAEEVEFNYSGGQEWKISVSSFNKPISSANTVCVFWGSETDEITSASAGLRWANILVFYPMDNGEYRLKEYGNNLDNGSILGYNEKVKIPKGGFVLAFSGGDSDANNVYDDIAKQEGVIYNTTAHLKSAYKGTVTGVFGDHIEIVVVKAVDK